MKKYESYLHSPFKMYGIEEKHYVTKQDEQVMQLTDGDDLYAVRKIPKSRLQMHDSLSYVKLFVDAWSHLKGLSPLSTKIIVYGVSNMRPLSQVVWLNPPDIMLECGIKSPNTIRGAIEDLIDNKIIAQKLGSNIEFWINPNVFFNGNRIRLI